MLLQEKNLQLKDNLNKDNLNEFVKSKVKNENKINFNLDKIVTQKELVYEEIARINQLIQGKTTSISIPAPISGIVVENYVKEGDFVKSGEDILAISPGKLQLFAYIRESEKDKVNDDLTAKVRINNKIFSAYIKNIQEKVINPPPQLKNRGLVSLQTYYFTVELSTHEMPQDVFSGQTGTVFFNE